MFLSVRQLNKYFNIFLSRKLIWKFILIGTPASLYLSSQQWDFPNGWSPLQAFLIQGLDYTNYGPAQRVAEKLAEVWLYSNYKGFVEKDTIFEKVQFKNNHTTFVLPVVNFLKKK